MAVCGVCFRHCNLGEGQTGFCGARICAGGIVRAANYGRITSLALDPVEKKPLRRFRPGSLILSAGSYGCNLRCPFCQNYEISWSEQAMRYADRAELATPEQIAETALYYRKKGNIGVAFTYNEPLVGYEFVRDTAKLVREKGMVNVLVSNGTAEISVYDIDGKPVPCNKKNKKSNTFTMVYTKKLAPGASTKEGGWKVVDYKLPKSLTVSEYVIRIVSFEIDHDWIKTIRKNKQPTKKCPVHL